MSRARALASRTRFACVTTLLLPWFAVALVAAPAGAANLLTNPNFNSNVSGWDAWGQLAQIYWDASPHGNPTGGAVEVHHLRPLHNSINGVAQCIPVTPGTTYTLRTSTYFPSPAVSSYVAMRAWWYSDSCVVTQPPGAYPQGQTASTDSWLQLSSSATAPAGATHALVLFGIVKNTDSGQDIEAYFDNTFFGTDGGGGSTCTPDATTACLLNNRFRATVRYRGGFDNSPADTNALRKPVLGFAAPTFETVFFYFNSDNNIEILLKMLDQGNTDGAGHPTIAVLFGSATPLRTEVTITDTTNGATKTYTSAFNTQVGKTDFTAFIK